VEDSDNKFTKSYSNLVYGSVPPYLKIHRVDGFHSFGAFGRPTKKRVFIVDFLKWAPGGFLAWYSDRDNRPGMGQLRENKMYAREVAEKLIASKRQELKDGNSQRDVLSLLGSSCSAFIRSGIHRNFKSFSEGKFCSTAGLETER